MKVTKQQASENRDAIVQVAAAQMRERGFGQTSVAEVAKAAGLTHGALYSHFDSKDALQAEAIEHAFEQCRTKFSGLTSDQFIDHYLSAEHRDNPAQGCPTAALVSEVRGQSDEARAAFYSGHKRFAALVERSLGSVGSEQARDRTTLAVAAMVGGLAIARAIRSVDETASNDVLRVVADQVRQVIAMSPPEGSGAGSSRASAKPKPVKHGPMPARAKPHGRQARH